MGERRGVKALEVWCRRLTEGYPGVKIDNMTTSWRDGLAFCAIIHHFRPDLIDFSKLRPDDVYYNNSLAFRVAERHLGVPALLDPEDMVEFPVPDRLSILTYLSQFYQVFVGTQGSPARIVPKRPSVSSDSLSSPSTSPPAKMATRSSVGFGRKEPCSKCQQAVFLAERLNVGSKLYHRTCFRCARCNQQLSLASCYETEQDGIFCCETCPDEEKDQPDTPEPNTHMLLRSVSDEQKSRSLNRSEKVDLSPESNFTLEESPIAKSRKEFWESHLLTEEEIDSMNIVVDDLEESQTKDSSEDIEEEKPSSSNALKVENSAPKTEISKNLVQKFILEVEPPSPLNLEKKIRLASSKISSEDVVLRNKEKEASPSKELHFKDIILKKVEKEYVSSPGLSSGDVLKKKEEEASTSKELSSEDIALNKDMSSGDVILRKNETSPSTSKKLLSENQFLSKKDIDPQKTDPPDLGFTAKNPVVNSSVKSSVNSKNSQQEAALDEENVTKDRTSLIKSRISIFENVPSKKLVPPKNSLNLSDSVPSKKIAKYFGGVSTSQENITKSRPHSTENLASKPATDEKTMKNIEAVSKYFGPKKAAPEKSASNQNLNIIEEKKKDFLRLRSKSKSYSDLSENYQTAVSNTSDSDNSYDSSTAPQQPKINEEESTNEISKSPNENLDPIKLKMELHKEISKSKEDLRQDISNYQTDVQERLQKSKEEFLETKNNPPSVVPRKISLTDHKNKFSDGPSSSNGKEVPKNIDLTKSTPDLTQIAKLLPLKSSIETKSTSDLLEISKIEEYPEELNPFGSDDETSEPQTPLRVIKPSKEDSILSPFSTTSEDSWKKGSAPYGSKLSSIASGTDDSFTIGKPSKLPEEGNVKKILKAPRISLNPFWSDDEEPVEEETKKPEPLPRRHIITPEPKPRRTGLNAEKYDSTSSLSSLSSSFSSTTPNRKKKPAPKPPISSEKNTLENTSADSTKITPTLHKKSRKAPLPPCSTPNIGAKNTTMSPISPIVNENGKKISPMECETSSEDATFLSAMQDSVPSEVDIEQEKNDKDSQNRNRQSQSFTSPQSDQESPSKPIGDKSTFGKWKRKKGPAPSRPVPQRRQIQPLPQAQIKEELQMIELQQQGMERQGVKLEQMIREKCEALPDEVALPLEIEDLILQLFELVNEKNELFRRQAELMYLRRQQRLEEEYADLEYQIRCLMDQPECNRTDSDKAREEELINRLVEVVERRNEIVECLEMDRVREAEEDLSISSRLILIQSQREEDSLKSLTESPIKLSKKEKKKIKKEKKLKEKGKNIDVDKDIDTTETANIKEKKKKKWF